MREHKGNSIIALPTDYIVIDTETTGLDFEHCDIIELSAVKYTAGQPTETFSSLIKPRLSTTYYPLRNNGEGEWITRYVDDFITDLTGITNEMLAGAPEPTEVLPRFLSFIGNSVLIAHNAHFDINFIYDAVEKHCNTIFSNDFIDTLKIARKVFPDLAHHRLSDVAEACHVEQQNAHRAETDCLVTGQCYEYMRSQILTQYSEAEFQKLYKMKGTRYKEALLSVTANVDDIDDTNPIFGKVIVFTGALSSMTRKEAFQLAVNLGAIPEDSITKKTNYLVIGSTEYTQSIKEGKTKKMIKAEGYKQKGAEISIVSENAFFDLISEYT